MLGLGGQVEDLQKKYITDRFANQKGAANSWVDAKLTQLDIGSLLWVRTALLALVQLCEGMIEPTDSASQM